MPMLAQTRFWFLRHGETDWNAKGWSQGNVDIPLNATGIAQAQAAAPLLVNRGIASIVASPLSRAHDTAKVAGELLGLPVHLDEGLRETAFGDKEGQPMSEWFSHWVEGSYTPPNGESFVDLRTRAVAAVNRALERPGLVLIVAHGALFRALRAEMGLEPNVRTRNAWPMLCDPGAPWTLTDAA
jgi:broad specificity phosphatase PhoE